MNGSYKIDSRSYIAFNFGLYEDEQKKMGQQCPTLETMKLAK